MTVFGIVAEGHTDQVVIEQILLGYFADQPGEPDVRYVQPPLDTTGSHGAPGAGWTVLKTWLTGEGPRQALQFFDYLIVHIDTDVCDQPGFDVAKHDGQLGRALTVPELVERVRERLVEWIGPGFHAQYASRFLFAIAVDETECWLLPLLSKQPKVRAKTTGCLTTANKLLTKANRPRLSRAAGKDPASYAREAAPFRKRKILLDEAPHNESLKLFVEDLADRAIQIPD